MKAPILSVIGAGGLLGRSVVRIGQRAGMQVVPHTKLPWEVADEAAAQIMSRHANLVAGDDLDGGGWIIAWCAGIGRVGAKEDELESESILLRTVITHAVEIADRLGIKTTFEFASSAGAVWSGSQDRVFDESTPTNAWHPYGRVKLAQEAAVVSAVQSSSHVRARLARISNLYGPQPAGLPPKGLIGYLVSNALSRIPTPIYVPLDTQRDYIFVQDAGKMMVGDAVDALRQPPGSSQVDLIASGRSHTIAHVATVLSNVFGRRVPLTVGFSSLSSQQPAVITFRSWRRNLEALSTITLSDGLRRMVDDSLTT